MYIQCVVLIYHRQCTTQICPLAFSTNQYINMLHNMHFSPNSRWLTHPIPVETILIQYAGCEVRLLHSNPMCRASYGMEKQ